MNSIPVIPRMEDLPYNSSPPIEFIYTSSKPLTGGKYIWTERPQALTPTRPIMHNSLYYFRSITLAADIEETDYTSNLDPVAIPSFQMYLQSRAQAILFREAILFPKFLQNFDYRLTWLSHKENDTLFASFNGTIIQGPTLAGKISVKLIAIISAQEIIDDGYISQFKANYPAPEGY